MSPNTRRDLPGSPREIPLEFMPLNQRDMQAHRDWFKDGQVDATINLDGLPAVQQRCRISGKSCFYDGLYPGFWTQTGRAIQLSELCTSSKRRSLAADDVLSASRGAETALSD